MTYSYIIFEKIFDKEIQLFWFADFSKPYLMTSLGFFENNR